MAYHLPHFNLVCNVWHGYEFLVDAIIEDPDIAGLECGLRFPRGHMQEVDYEGDTFEPGLKWIYGMHLMVPALTDLRSRVMGVFPDYVEVPANTARFYRVSFVDDVAKGHPNEFRQAYLTQVIMPTPLP